MTVVEEYVSCREQKINGRLYCVNQVVPDAGTLTTLPALIRTNRLRLRSAYVSAPEEVVGQDLGMAQSRKAKAKHKSKAKR